MTQPELASLASPPHRACTQLMVPGLPDDTVHRSVLGEDDQPRQLKADEIGQLGDQFALRLLNAGIFPNTAGEVLRALEQVEQGGPLADQNFFLLGEGSQLPADVVGASRNMRFLITCGRGAEGAEVIVSSFHPDQGMVEVIAWDHVRGGFNFYRTMPDSNAWVFAGNSRHALTEPTRGHGPFESHVNGHVLMKELKTPWVNWHSPFAQIPATSLAQQGLDTHPWVDRLEPGGAYTLEDNAVRPGIRRWTSVRVAAVGSQTSAETPNRFLEQLTTTLTVNITSSQTTSDSALGGSTPVVDLPSTFFVDADMLDVLDLPAPPRLSVAPQIYKQTLDDLNVQIGDGGSFSRPGDTHFAFVVPERAFEDVETMRQAIDAGLLSPRLVACLTMVDFPNPIFSRQRSTLTRHLTAVPWDGSGVEFSTAVAAAINASPQAATAGTAESEFTANWAVGDDFSAEFSARLIAYYERIQEALQTPRGFRDAYLLAESRRHEVETMPIFESRLLFPTSDAPIGLRAMTVEGSVVDVPA